MWLWGFISLIFFGLAEPSMATQESSALSDPEVAAQHIIKNSKKPKGHAKKHKSKKKLKIKKSKRSKKKPKVYSPQKIDRLIHNGHDEGTCSRLNCSSKLEVAKSCLKTRADHRVNRECFQSFCAYGCNEEDYDTKYEVYEFCNKTCSSRKYGNH